jgi:hypothetical protein
MISQSTDQAIQHLLGFYDLVQAEMNPRCARSPTPKSLQPIYLSSYE